MILSYLKETGKSLPEIQMKAEGLIGTGYQRLLTFEVQGGGFSWFGTPPAHKLLTAYGLMEFSDMKAVYPIDESIIERTQRWISSQQSADGSFEPDSREIHSGAQFSGRTDMYTAYMAWALLESGCKGQATDRAIGYLKSRLDSIDDPYALALIANALGLQSPKGPDTAKVIAKLVKLAIVDGEKAHWECSTTATGSSGACGNIEATALAAQALLRFSGEAGLVQKSLAWLVSSKDSLGTWGSTQATVLALRVLMQSQKKSMKRLGKIKLMIGGKEHSTFIITPESSDVLQVADLRDVVRTGENSIDLALEGEGTYMYQIVGKYYLPWKDLPLSRPKLTIKVSYDRTTLSADDIVKARASIVYGGDKTSSMVIADLGVPPGFTVMTGDFDELRDSGVISRYEQTPRKIIVYISGLAPGAKVEMPYRLKARFPIRAKTPSSAVYEYYNPENRGVDEPQSMNVK